MARVLSWSLWIAGIIAVLRGIGLVELPLKIVFVQIDMTMILVGLICLFNAYARVTLSPRV